MGRLCFFCLALVACMSGDKPGDASSRTLVAFNAGSLSRPLRAALDTFAAVEGIEVQQESAGSLETARKIMELHKVPDIVALADHEVFTQLLIPEHTTWYVQFARNRMVLAYTDRSKFADEITPANWWQVFQRAGVEVGRADPSQDPNGYRTLLTLQLAERHYSQPGLYRELLARSPERNVRPKEADLVAMVQAGEMDFVWSYESVAQGAGLKYVTLPPEIDLSSPAHAAFYQTASIRVRGGAVTDSIAFRGAPIVYGVSIPTRAPNRAVAERFLVWLLSADGQRVLRREGLDALERPLPVGNSLPTLVAGSLR